MSKIDALRNNQVGFSGCIVMEPPRGTPFQCTWYPRAMVSRSTAASPPC